MTVQVWINGARVEREEARVSVFDRGFLYGDSVFETLRTYGGRPFALAEHLTRLEESAKRVAIRLPVAVEQLAVELERASVESETPESYLRLMVTRGQGELGLDPGTALQPLRVLLVAPLEPLPSSVYEEGISVASFVTARQTDGIAAGAKIGNYLVAVLAAEQARRVGARESLIVDAQGKVTEGATSNVFWVAGGRLWTPGEDAGILAGITRAHILKVAESLGLPVEFRTPDLEELCVADEVFISSSIREIVPVVRIDERNVSSGKPGRITRSVLQAFRAHVRSSVHST